MLRLALILGLVLTPGLAAAAPWTLDPATEVSVDVPWRGSDVKVRFSGLQGQVDFDETSPEAAKARISVAAASAETGVGVVNALVKSEGYLDAARFPTISFQLDKLTRLSKSEARVDGRLTLRGVTRPVSLDAKVLRYGPAKDDPDRFEAGFDIEGTIDRTTFGSTGGLPEVPADLDLRIRLLMSSQ